MITAETPNGLADSPWPSEGGNNRHSGLSNYSTSNNPGKKVWFYSVDDEVQGTPIIGPDDTIYFGCGDNVFNKCTDFIALNPEGKKVWRLKLKDAVQTTPVMDKNNQIYFTSATKDKLYAVSSSGKILWDFTPDHGYLYSPVIGADGGIYFTGMWSMLYKVDATGQLVWKKNLDPINFPSQPAITDDGRIIFGDGDDLNHDSNGHIYCLGPDGKTNWTYQNRSLWTSSPVIGSDRTIYLIERGSWDIDYYLDCFSPEGVEKWRIEFNESLMARPAVGSDGTVYLTSGSPADHDYHLNAITPDGKIKWRFNVNESVFYSSPAIGSDGTIFFGSQTFWFPENTLLPHGPTNPKKVGSLYAVTPDGKLRWSYNNGNIIDYYSPIIGRNGTIYVGTDNGVLAIGIPYPTPQVKKSFIPSNDAVTFIIALILVMGISRKIKLQPIRNRPL
jgi:outer membrane protein assembly factor BamB